MRGLLILFTISLLLAPTNGQASTLFSGNYIDLATDKNQVCLGLNYPRLGEKELCGFELKTTVLVLNPRVWQDLANKLSVTEQCDDGERAVLTPIIRREYSPTLSYQASCLGAPYVRFFIDTKNQESLIENLAEVFQQPPKQVRLIAVGRVCT